MGRWHRALVHERRVGVLVELLVQEIPNRAHVLDIGCGDGTIGYLLAERRPDISIEGAEVEARPGCRIPCHTFDGEKLPFDDLSFDVCLFVDVLHHTRDVSILLSEAARVSRSFVVLKDHLSENGLDHATLQFMDWVGNRPHGVHLPYNYQSRKEWMRHFMENGLAMSTWTTEVPLYPFPFSLVAGRQLHFVARLRKL
jgi:SAM-dependent methyltransferase